MTFVARELAPARAGSGRKRLNTFSQGNRAVCDQACFKVQREQGIVSDFRKGRH